MPRLYPVVVRRSSGGGAPTVVIKDVAGATDTLVLAPSLGDTAGVADPKLSLVPSPTDSAGAMDALSITGVPSFDDKVGCRDTQLVQVDEQARPRSGTPDTDPWEDAWVDRLLANQGVNHGADALLNVAALTAATQQDAYVAIDFTRLAGLRAGAGQSYLSFLVDWPSVAAAPQQLLLVDLRSNATRPFVESTATASNKARFTASPPYTRRSFSNPLSGAAFGVSLLLDPTEVNDFVGKWLEVQLTTPDLGTSTLTCRSRESTAPPLYRLFLQL